MDEQKNKGRSQLKLQKPVVNWWLVMICKEEEESSLRKCLHDKKRARHEMMTNSGVLQTTEHLSKGGWLSS